MIRYRVVTRIKIPEGQTMEAQKKLCRYTGTEFPIFVQWGRIYEIEGRKFRLTTEFEPTGKIIRKEPVYRMATFLEEVEFETPELEIAA